MGEKSSKSPARSGAEDVACGSSKCIPRMRKADARKDSAFNANTASLPKNAATIPPRVAPIIKFNDQVVEESVFARITSSLLVIFGITAFLAGSKKVAMQVSRNKRG